MLARRWPRTGQAAHHQHNARPLRAQASVLARAKPAAAVASDLHVAWTRVGAWLRIRCATPGESALHRAAVPDGRAAPARFATAAQSVMLCPVLAPCAVTSGISVAPLRPVQRESVKQVPTPAPRAVRLATRVVPVQSARRDSVIQAPILVRREAPLESTHWPLVIIRVELVVWTQEQCACGSRRASCCDQTRVATNKELRQQG